MSVRPFDWRDLPTLHRYRRESVFLHTSLVLTRGPWLISGAILSSLTPAVGISTSVSTAKDSGRPPLIGQIFHLPGAQNAQLTFLTPEAAMQGSQLPGLLEHLSMQAVDHGGLRMLADVEEDNLAFETMRQMGFGIYARQRIWRINSRASAQADSAALQAGWQPAIERDLIPVRSLYNNLVPGLVQQVEPFPADRLNGYVYRQDDDLLAYVELKYGNRGIWAQPFIHPDAEDVAVLVVDLLSSLPNRISRPVYLCIRSYQSWLELALQDLGAESSPRQAIMVKHLAIPQKALRTFSLPALEGGRPEVSAPVSNAQRSSARAAPANAEKTYTL